MLHVDRDNYSNPDIQRNPEGVKTRHIKLNHIYLV